MSLKPGLAESWSAGRRANLGIQAPQGVKFHDGAALTAKDVKASIELASGLNADPKAALPITANWAGRRKGTIVDDFTVRFCRQEAVRPDAEHARLHRHHRRVRYREGKESLEKHPNGTGAFKLTDDKPNVKTPRPLDDHSSRPGEDPADDPGVHQGRANTAECDSAG
jgi:peptide/nickel transport system substrate-binding protein